MEKSCLYYEMAVELFENMQYEEAVLAFIKSYELGEKQEEILKILYDCFILPNEAEFRENYKKNNQGISTSLYEELLIDFIPVSDGKFYLFDRERRQFQGWIDLEETWERAEILEFQSVLIGDIWDVREMFPVLQAKNWSTVYILLNEQEKKFMSFFKLPDFKRKYLERAAIFCDTDLMKTFFRNCPQFYLPKQIAARQLEKYKAIISELHQERIQRKREENSNVFLSICIPSFNRGELALRSVKNILNLPYDSEIEVVISNNGSEKETEAYHQIRDLNDTRIVYHEFEKNQGAATNIKKVLELASGKFAMLASDEDLLILDRVDEFLNIVFNHRSAAGFFVGTTSGFYNDKVSGEKGCGSLIIALNGNYLTGTVLNTEILQEHNILDKFEELRGNIFAENYTHVTIAAMASEWGYVLRGEIILWKDVPDEFLGKQEMRSFMTIESRIAQQNACMEIIDKALHLNVRDFIQISFERMAKTYELLDSLAVLRTKTFLQHYTWEEVCQRLYQNNIQFWEKFWKNKEKRLESTKEYVMKCTIEEYFEKLNRSPFRKKWSVLESKENEAVYAIARCQYEQGKKIEEINLNEIREQVKEMIYPQ